MIVRSKTRSFAVLAIRSIDRHIIGHGRDGASSRSTTCWRRPPRCSGAAATPRPRCPTSTRPPGSSPAASTPCSRTRRTLFRRCFEAYAAFFRRTLPTDAGRRRRRSEAWLDLQARLPRRPRPQRLPDRQHAGRARGPFGSHARPGQLAACRRSAISSSASWRSPPSAASCRRRPRLEAAADALVGAVIGIMALGRPAPTGT